MIETRQNRGGLYLKLSNLDVLTKLTKLVDGANPPYKLRPEDGRFVPRSAAMGHDVPWVYVLSDHRARCDIYHTVFFSLLEHVHSYCRNCYKVVVRPRNLVELFDLYELQKAMAVPAKCGIEVRDTVHGLYGGYFYTRGIEEGRARYEQVRAAVNERLAPKTTVLLKRYCTEFEIGPGAKGPSDKTPDCTREEIEWELMIEALFPRVGFASSQPDWVVAHVMREWIHHAYRNGDQSYKEFTGGDPLFPGYVTYHQQHEE
jgi:hypothetical protein